MVDVLKAYLEYVKNELGCTRSSCEECKFNCGIFEREVSFYNLNLPTLGEFYYIKDSVDGGRIGVLLGKNFYAIAKDADYKGELNDLLNNPIKEVVRSPKSDFSDAFFRLLECYIDEDELYENLANEFLRSSIMDNSINIEKFYNKISCLFSFDRLFFRLMHYIFKSEMEFSNKEEFKKFLIYTFGDEKVYK